MKAILFLLLLFGSLRGNTTNYYFSNDGNDITGSGTIGNPYSTFVKFNALSFTAGDSILFKRGDIFYGTMRMPSSGSTSSSIIIGAYGTGAKPVFSGLLNVSGWSNVNGNIWQANVSNVKNNVNLVIRDNKIQQVGRYPNADATNGGFLTATGGTMAALNGTSTLTGPALSATTNWTNAEIAIKIKAWDIQRAKVTAHSGGTVSYTEPFGYYATDAGFGYFFQRDPRTLDQDGEWYHDTATSKLQMYFGDNTPNTHNVSISTVDTFIYSLNKNYITVRDIQFTGANATAIYYQNAINFKISNCDFNYMGKDAAYGFFCFNAVIDSSTTKNCLASGFFLSNSSSVNPVQTVTNCWTDSTAMIGGMDRSGDGTPRSGITIIGDSLLIEYNKVTNSGYIAIEWQGSRAYIKHNYVDTFGVVKNDVGGIYVYEGFANPKLPIRSNRYVIKNVVLHGLVNPYGVAVLGYSNGIYFDGGSRNVIADSNTVAYMSGFGFHTNSPDTVSITNNVVYQCAGSISISRWAGTLSSRTIAVKKNVFYPHIFRYSNLAIDNPAISVDADILALGVVDSNHYSLRPGLDTLVYGFTTLENGTSYTGFFRNSTYTNKIIGIEQASTRIKSGGVFSYNPTRYPMTVNLSSYSYYNIVTGSRYFNSLVIPPFSSLILTNPTIIYESESKIKRRFIIH